jgi:hypothetical protein
MAHTHDHPHDHPSYYTEQLTTIGICGALGAVAVLLWARGLLQWILKPQFFLPVVLGGAVLLALVIVRAIAVWVSAGRQDAAHQHDHHHHDQEHCDHDHEHDHTHEHSHTHIQTHDHGHEHGWAPWRYVLLLLPLVLYFLNLPNEGLSRSYGRTVDAGNVDVSDVAGAKGKRNVTFLELERASYRPSTREDYTGYIVTIKGQFQPSPVSNKRFTLYRDKMNCCAADAIRLNLVIDSPTDLDVAALAGRWVEVTVPVTFAKRPGKEEYLPVLIMRDAKDLQPTTPELTHYIY